MQTLYFALSVPDREALRFLEEEQRERRGYTKEARQTLQGKKAIQIAKAWR